jgi:eps6N
VIVWKESALAEFISSQKLGLVISSLYELSDILDTITEKQYQEFVENIQEVREKLKKGFYLKKSINEILT